MKYADREGNYFVFETNQDELLKKIYESKSGIFLLKLLVRPWVSKIGGAFLNTRISKLLIKPFIKKNNIDMDMYEDTEYKSYNDFFMRKIKENVRKVDNNKEAVIAPCDSRLTVYDISDAGTFSIKNTEYTMESLCRSKSIAKHYNGGKALVFRLCVDDYHRYCYVAEGETSDIYKIPGVFHTVNPIANDHFKIYKENQREFSFLRTKEFGTILMMEVGALMVGRIVNDNEDIYVKRGAEKGHFEFGGSTVVICYEKDKVNIDRDIEHNSGLGIETLVKYGEKIGNKR